MKTIALLSVVWVTFSLVSCRKPPAEVKIQQTREFTTVDEEPRVHASSGQQFLPEEFLRQLEGSGMGADAGDAQLGWSYTLPATDWKDAGKKSFRDVNLTFGAGEKQGEIYLSVVGGGIEPNINRWYGQFGSQSQSLDSLQRIPMLGKSGYLVETSGRYEPGMGRAGKDNQALLGAIVESEGRLVTVKMIGPAAEIASRREQFSQFVSSLARK